MTAVVKVGLLDSGVKSGSVPAAAAARFRITADGSVERGPGGDDRLGHGTALARIITKVPVPVALFDAAIFADRLVTQAAVVAAGLDWLTAAGVRLVNLSFGLRTDRVILRRACEQALESGVILIAAAPARGPAVFPGSYPGVIRATGDARCALGEISDLGGGQADFAGHPRPLDNDRQPRRLGGASFGTAHVTAAIAEFLSREPEAGRAEVLRHLAVIAKYHGPERRRFTEGPS
jgi:subtilisin family serine protease